MYEEEGERGVKRLLLPRGEGGLRTPLPCANRNTRQEPHNLFVHSKLPTRGSAGGASFFFVDICELESVLSQRQEAVVASHQS